MIAAVVFENPTVVEEASAQKAKMARILVFVNTRLGVMLGTTNLFAHEKRPVKSRQTEQIAIQTASLLNEWKKVIKLSLVSLSNDGEVWKRKGKTFQAAPHDRASPRELYIVVSPGPTLK